ncbi:hypothetical protein STAS_12928 [Striga asiatica]|uniref:Uncharacterized protein n=1 Tax=Striga asiatica TaxID=4170 RepID=A0A5A7PUR0_STRAF|nr:hypothetical protein STAS_12928 [Striga asiatica]
MEVSLVSEKSHLTLSVNVVESRHLYVPGLMIVQSKVIEPSSKALDVRRRKLKSLNLKKKKIVLKGAVRHQNFLKVILNSNKNADFMQLKVHCALEHLYMLRIVY